MKAICAPAQVCTLRQNTTTTVRELRAALATIEDERQVLIVLFQNDGTSEVFGRENAYANNDHAQLEIYEAETPNRLSRMKETEDDHP